MASQLFNSIGNNSPQSSPNLNFNRDFNAFVENFNNTCNVSPQQQVRELINSGRMTQEQFEQYRSIANAITGRRN